jgi:hypothetical protein
LIKENERIAAENKNLLKESEQKTAKISALRDELNAAMVKIDASKNLKSDGFEDILI